LGITRFYQGDFAGARALFDQGLAIDRPDPDRGFLALRFGRDPGAGAMLNLALALLSLGDPDPARRAIEQGVSRAIETGHMPSVAHAHQHKALFEIMRRSPERAAPHAEAAVDLCRQHGLSVFLAYSSVHRLWIRWKLGEQAEGATAMRHAVRRVRELGLRLGLPWCLAMLAEVEMEAGEVGAGLASIDAAVAEARCTGERHYLAECHRLRAEILLARDPLDIAAAEQAFRAALALAQQQKARGFALRAALSLARLWHSAGRDAEARAVLSAALVGFRPTPELPDIEQARTLLATLPESSG
jgi:predicted ATPase